MSARRKLFVLCMAFGAITLTNFSSFNTAAEPISEHTKVTTASPRVSAKKPKKSPSAKSRKEATNNPDTPPSQELPWPYMFWGTLFTTIVLAFSLIKKRIKYRQQIAECRSNNQKLQTQNNIETSQNVACKEQCARLKNENDRLNKKVNSCATPTLTAEKIKGDKFEHYVVKEIHARLNGENLTGTDKSKKQLGAYQDEDADNQKWIFTDWRGDKYIEIEGARGLYARSNTLPDLEFVRIRDGHRVLIECKYRSNWSVTTDGKHSLHIVEQDKRHHLYKKYEKLRKDTNVRTYFYFGIDGLSDALSPEEKPKETYLFPLNALGESFALVTKEHLKKNNKTLDEIFDLLTPTT